MLHLKKRDVVVWHDDKMRRQKMPRQLSVPPFHRYKALNEAFMNFYIAILIPLLLILLFIHKTASLKNITYTPPASTIASCPRHLTSSPSSRQSPAKQTESVTTVYLILHNDSNKVQIQELLDTAAEAVKANEPGTLRYHLQREVKGDAPTFIMLETYATRLELDLNHSWLITRQL